MIQFDKLSWKLFKSRPLAIVKDLQVLLAGCGGVAVSA
jgi:hypothetical protein